MENYLNHTIVNELKLIMQDDINMLFQAYIDDTKCKIKDLSCVNLDTDCEFTRRLAHSIKGSSKNVGATQLSELCEALESAARNKQVQLWQELIDKINLSFIKTCTQINQEILFS